MEQGRLKIRLAWPPVSISTRLAEDWEPGGTDENTRDLDSGCRDPGVPFCAQSERQASAFALLKQRLLLQFLDAVDDHASHHLIINEANVTARLALGTGLPLLLYPCLFQERAADSLSIDRRRSSAYWKGLASM